MQDFNSSLLPAIRIKVFLQLLQWQISGFFFLQRGFALFQKQEGEKEREMNVVSCSIQGIMHMS